MAVSFLGGGNRSSRRKPDMSQIIDKLDHIMFYGVHLPMNRVQTHNFSGDRYWFIISHQGTMCVNEWLSFNAKWAIFQRYYDENNFNEMMMMSADVHWNNSSQADMSLHYCLDSTRTWGKHILTWHHWCALWKEYTVWHSPNLRH